MQNGLKCMFFMKKNFCSKDKMSQNIFADFSISEHSASFSLFEKKQLFLLQPGVCPPTTFSKKIFQNNPFQAFLKLYKIAMSAKGKGGGGSRL